MLFITYGLQKSASTFCFQLAYDIAWCSGHDQTALWDAFLRPSARDRYLPIDAFPVRDVAEAVPRDRVLVIKTHSPMSDDARSLLAEGLIRASATFRDPRDAAVAVLDAASKGRERTKNEAFGEVCTMADAIDLIADNLPNTTGWLADPRVLKLPFDLLATEPVAATHRLADYMGLEVDAAEIVKPYLTGRKAIFEFNEGLGGRHRERMTAADLDYARQRFGAHIEYFEELTQTVLRFQGAALPQQMTVHP